MSGETEASVSGWTVDTLHQHLAQKLDDQRAAFQLQIDQRFSGAETAVGAALEAAEKAVVKAEVASDKRFEGVNEFRKALTDQTAGFVPRTEYDAGYKSVVNKQEEQVKILTERLAALELRLTSRLDLNQGSAAGSSDTRTERRLDLTALMQFLGLVAVAIGLYAALRK